MRGFIGPLILLGGLIIFILLVWFVKSYSFNFSPNLKPSESSTYISIHPRSSESSKGNLVLTYEKNSGGFAGVCHNLNLYQTGYVYRDCHSGYKTGSLTASESGVLKDLTIKYKTIKLSWDEQQAVDGYTGKMEFYSQGTQNDDKSLVKGFADKIIFRIVSELNQWPGEERDKNTETKGAFHWDNSKSQVSELKKVLSFSFDYPVKHSSVERKLEESYLTDKIYYVDLGSAIFSKGDSATVNTYNKIQESTVIPFKVEWFDLSNLDQQNEYLLKRSLSLVSTEKTLKEEDKVIEKFFAKENQSANLNEEQQFVIYRMKSDNFGFWFTIDQRFASQDLEKEIVEIIKSLKIN